MFLRIKAIRKISFGEDRVFLLYLTSVDDLQEEFIMMRSSNPTLRENLFRGSGLAVPSAERMTIQGVVGKTTLMLLFVLLTAGWTWMRFYESGGNPNVVSGPMMLGLFGGFILAMVTIFKPVWSAVTGSLYALCQGLFLGGISAMMEAQFPGIVIQAASLTFGTLAVMLFAYQTGLVRATEKFKLGVVAATGAIALVYFVSLILGFFGMAVPFIHGSGMMGIGFSLLVVAIAALNLILDIDFIEQGAARGAPKYMEWYASFALMVTLVWLYIEFLRLLSKARSR